MVKKIRRLKRRKVEQQTAPEEVASRPRKLKRVKQVKRKAKPAAKLPALPLGGHAIAIPDVAKAFMFLNTVVSDGTYGMDKAKIGCTLEFAASIYYQHEGHTICVRDQQLDEANHVLLGAGNVFTKLPTEFDWRATHDGKACMVMLPADPEVQVAIAKHIAAIRKYVIQEMSPERLKEVADGAQN